MAGSGVSLDVLSDTVAAFQDVVRIGDDVVISDLEHDSRLVHPGAGFIAIRGANTDGHDHVSDAIARGARALIVERRLDVVLPQLVVADARKALGVLAAAVHGQPATKLTTIGVTGTNGKTTVTHLLDGIVRHQGLSSGLIGTIGAQIAEQRVPLRHTTPEATELHRLLATMVERGVDVVAMEVSSHALAMGRVDGVVFDAAGFTNLSQDHLDYHGSMEDYFAVKADLFTPQRSTRAWVVVRSSWGRRLAEQASVPVTTVALSGEADVVADHFESGVAGSRVDVTLDGRRIELHTPLAGWFNAENALLAAAIASGLGWSPAAIVAGIASVSAIPGRFERIDRGQPFAVIVDYAHTPEAMALAIDAARAMASGRVIALGGAGGDRDPAKRPAMGAALGQADLAVITSDNPRHEDPAAIVDQVLAGVSASSAHLVVVDRHEAIQAALAAAAPGDVVLLLGRGHETEQDLGDRHIPFSDGAVAAALLAERQRERS